MQMIQMHLGSFSSIAYHNQCSYPHPYHFQLLTELILLNFDYLFDLNWIKTQHFYDVPGFSGLDFHFKLKPTKCASRDNKSYHNWHVELTLKWCQGSGIHIHNSHTWCRLISYMSLPFTHQTSYVYNETKNFIWNKIKMKRTSTIKQFQEMSS